MRVVLMRMKLSGGERISRKGLQKISMGKGKLYYCISIQK